MNLTKTVSSLFKSAVLTLGVSTASGAEPTSQPTNINITIPDTISMQEQNGKKPIFISDDLTLKTKNKDTALDISADLEIIDYTFIKSEDTTVPKELRRPAFFTQQISGIPHNLILGIIREESNFDGNIKVKGGGLGYIQSVRDPFYHDLQTTLKKPAGDNLATDILKEILPEELPIAYSRYIKKDSEGNEHISGNLRLTIIDPNKLEKLEINEQDQVLASNHNILSWSTEKQIEHSKLVYKAENLDITNEIYEDISTHPIMSPLILVQRILRDAERLERNNCPLTSANTYGMHFHGEGAGLRKAILVKNDPNASILKAYGDDTALALKKHSTSINHPTNRNFFYNEDDTFKTVQQSRDYTIKSKGFSDEPIDLMDNDNTLANGLRDGTISIEFAIPARLKENLMTIQQRQSDLVAIENSIKQHKNNPTAEYESELGY